MTRCFVDYLEKLVGLVNDKPLDPGEIDQRRLVVDHVDEAVGRADQDVVLGLARLRPLCFHLSIIRLLTSVVIRIGEAN
jgi:hypothetical protein